MSAIWLLSTRGRPKAAQEVLDACEETGMTSPGVVYVDETVDVYRKLRLPENWTIHYEPTWGSLQASMQWVYREYPNASQYGWLADDNIPLSDGWDKQLEKSAGDFCLSYANDLWLSETDPDHLVKGTNLSSGLCWGGKLVRAVGWWALPGVRQAGIDTAWCALVSPFGLHRYRPDVVVEHRHYRTGKREHDQGDEWTRNGVPYVADDVALRDGWVWSPRFWETMEKIAAAADIPEDRKKAALYRSESVNSLIPRARLERWLAA